MKRVPYDSVTVIRDGRSVRLTAEQFAELPMNERVRAILEKTLQFYSGGQLLDRASVLRELRQAAVHRS